MVAVAFFGVRRGAEVINFKMNNIVDTTGTGIQLKVTCQKNDQNGLGQMCLIPRVKAMEAWSPDLVLQRWLDARQVLVRSASPDDFVFITTTGTNKGGQVSTDSLRKHVVAAFGHSVATHSLRKGGATCYDRQGAMEEATKQQGGWRTTELM